MRERMFYRVNKVMETGGIDLLAISPLLTEGRIIRWRSSGAEYGLFEAVVCPGHGEINVRDSQTGRRGELYTEQVAEICLTREEAGSFGFGYPD